MHQVFGGCNNQKSALVECLHADTVERRRSHLKATAEKRNAMKKRWKEIEEEEYGKDGYLKEVRNAREQAKSQQMAAEETKKAE